MPDDEMLLREVLLSNNNFRKQTLRFSLPKLSKSSKCICQANPAKPLFYERKCAPKASVCETIALRISSVCSPESV